MNEFSPHRKIGLRRPFLIAGRALARLLMLEWTFIEENAYGILAKGLNLKEINLSRSVSFSVAEVAYH